MVLTDKEVDEIDFRPWRSIRDIVRGVERIVLAKQQRQVAERARRGFMPGRRMHVCRRCSKDFFGSDDAWTCAPCADAAIEADD